MNPVEIQNPSTWMKFKSSLCEGCWAGCCTLPAEVSLNDLIRLEVVNEDEARESLSKVARKLMRKGIVRAYRAKPGLFILEQTSAGDCIFLDQNRRCRVYAK